MIYKGHAYYDIKTGEILDVWFSFEENAISRSCLAEEYGIIRGGFIEVERLDLFAKPTSTKEAYLVLHLLSSCRIKPNEVDLTHIFGLLPTVAWTSAGPILPENINVLRRAISASMHHLQVFSIDKFPRMTDYVLPEGVRIADADRVRLGAHLSKGTTVMHEGFINFNAGTLGQAMIEGRITPGVVIGENSDIGAGASIMGMLSGGGQHKNAVGKKALLGANAGIGISLGDNCIVEAGLYVTAGTKVRLPDGTIVKASDLSGQPDLLFRRNSQSGKVEALPRGNENWSGLNNSLHAT